MGRLPVGAHPRPGARSRAALVGRSLRALGGGLIYWEYAWPVLTSIAWFPWMLMGLALAQDNTRGPALGFGAGVLGAATGLAFLGGHPGMSFYELLALTAMHLAWLATPSPTANRWASAWRALAAAGLGDGLALRRPSLGHQARRDPVPARPCSESARRVNSAPCPLRPWARRSGAAGPGPAGRRCDSFPGRVLALWAPTSRRGWPLLPRPGRAAVGRPWLRPARSRAVAAFGPGPGSCSLPTPWGRWDPALCQLLASAACPCLIICGRRTRPWA